MSTLKKFILTIFVALATHFLFAQKITTDLDANLNTLIESGMKKFVDLKGDSTSVLADEYFKQYSSKLQIKGFKYNLITYYPSGKLFFFTGLFLQTSNQKRALAAYKLLADSVENVRLKCCTFKREPGVDLENERKTYYKPFARPKEYANLQLIVALESVSQKNGKLKYAIILYVYANPPQ